MIRAIIIDDEQHCVKNILELAKQHSTISIEGTFNSVEDGLKGTKALKPDLVFLDVEIHEKTGFNYLEQLTYRNFHVVFTTAFDKYAVRAFEFSALHYLLKPIISEDFIEIIRRINNEKSTVDKLSEKIDALLYNQKVKDAERRITINGSDSNTVLQVSDILYCKSDINCTFFYMSDNRKIFSSKTLKTYTDLFIDSDFCRVHQSYLVNLKHVRKYTKGKPPFVYMSNNDKIKVSINNKSELLKKLNNLK